MGKKRDLGDHFTQSTESLTGNSKTLDKLRHDLRVSTAQQERLVTLIRHEIPDSYNHKTRNLIQGLTNQILFLVDRIQTLTSETWDHSTVLYIKAHNRTKKAKTARN
jgi:hypothetical protein